MRRRVFGVSLLLVAVICNTAWAQTPLPSAALQSNLPSAPLQMWLPSATMPNPSPTSPAPDIYRAGPNTYAPRFDQLQPPPLFPCCGGFYGGYYDPSLTYGMGRYARRVPKEERRGYLQLDVQPRSAQVYVDGYYKGTVDDVGRMLTLDPGPRRIELRAPGFKPVTIDVRIVPEETITYRAELEPAPAEKPVARAPAVPKTFYVIPNCYAGDKPPMPAALPPSCDIANLRTIPPVVNAFRPTP